MAQLLAAAPGGRTGRHGSPRTVVVNRHNDAEVLEAHAEAHLESLNSLITRLPAETSNEYETYIQSVIAQCVKAEMLAANSWRVAVNAGRESADRLMAHLKAPGGRSEPGCWPGCPDAIGTRFDQACSAVGLPEAVIAALLGVSGRGDVGHPQPGRHPARRAAAGPRVRGGAA